MKSCDGIRKFLDGLISRSEMTADDLEKAIQITGNYSPSSAFKRAREYWRISHLSTNSMCALAFAKGVRWLAMLRRDEGQEAFETECERLRGLIK